MSNETGPEVSATLAVEDLEATSEATITALRTKFNDLISILSQAELSANGRAEAKRIEDQSEAKHTAAEAALELEIDALDGVVDILDANVSDLESNVLALESSVEAARANVSILETQLLQNGIVPLTQGSSAQPQGAQSSGPSGGDEPLSPEAMLGVGLAAGIILTLGIALVLLWTTRCGAPSRHETTAGASKGAPGRAPDSTGSAAATAAAATAESV